MNVRSLVVTLAVPLVLGTACKTSGSQSQGGSTPTASSSDQSSPSVGDEQGSASAPGSQSGSQGSAASPGAQSGATSAQDPLMEPGPAIKGHASDQVVSGHVGRVSPYAVAIVSDTGDMTILEIVPQTSIIVDGQDATSSQLQEGQPVRASFNQVDGQDVAVEIDVIPAPGGASGQGGSSTGSPGGTGSSGAPSDSTQGGSVGGGSSQDSSDGSSGYGGTQH